MSDPKNAPHAGEAGFTLAETLIATALLMIVSASVISALLQMTKSQSTIWNRTEMHSGVRSATELLQQEVGQAGRVSLPQTTTYKLSGNVVAGSGGRTVSLTSVTGLFLGEIITVDAGSAANCPTVVLVGCQETVKIVAFPGGTQITADSKLLLDAGVATPGFQFGHSTNAPVAVYGGFASGIVPTDYPTSPSDGTHLKLYGDLNSDGNMQYVEYNCDTTNGYLYRNVMAFDQTLPKPAAQILLSNIDVNPGGTPCFTYQQQTVVGTTFVTDVAITLTVKTQQVDPITKQQQKETKVLLNVSPRNVFNVWQLMSANLNDHVQPMPPSVTTLLP